MSGLVYCFRVDRELRAPITGMMQETKESLMLGRERRRRLRSTYSIEVLFSAAISAYLHAAGRLRRKETMSVYRFRGWANRDRIAARRSVAG
jgi:hypothetical protein